MQTYRVQYTDDGYLAKVAIVVAASRFDAGMALQDQASLEGVHRVLTHIELDEQEG